MTSAADGRLLMLLDMAGSKCGDSMLEKEAMGGTVGNGEGATVVAAAGATAAAALEPRDWCAEQLRSCLRRLLLLIKSRGQCAHLYGRSPPCRRRCRTMLPESLHWKPQLSHVNTLAFRAAHHCAPTSMGRASGEDVLFVSAAASPKWVKFAGHDSRTARDPTNRCCRRWTQYERQSCAHGAGRVGGPKRRR